MGCRFGALGCYFEGFGIRLLLFQFRYEKKYGRDGNDAQPRCLYAAKVISAMDPTGETALKHRIAAGQLQDLHTTFISMDQLLASSFCL